MPSASGRPRCTAACPPSTGRKSWKPNSPASCWNAPPGARSPADLAFQDKPPAGALAAAAALLKDLGALDEQDRITGTGREMARIGSHPRLAAMMLAAGTDEQAALAADLAALLEERDPLRSQDAPADIATRLAAIAFGDPNADRGALAPNPPDRRPISPPHADSPEHPSHRRARSAAGRRLP